MTVDLSFLLLLKDPKQRHIKCTISRVGTYAVKLSDLVLLSLLVPDKPQSKHNPPLVQAYVLFCWKDLQALFTPQSLQGFRVIRSRNLAKLRQAPLRKHNTGWARHKTPAENEEHSFKKLK